jgi:virulence-associated protein VagC
MVEDALSEEILLGRIRLGDHVRVVREGDKLAFTPVENDDRELALAGQVKSD